MAGPKIYTQKKLAERLGVCRQTIARWLDGDYPKGFPLGSGLKRARGGKASISQSDMTSLEKWAKGKGARTEPADQSICKKRDSFYDDLADLKRRALEKIKKI